MKIIFSGLSLLKTRPWLNQETKVNVNNRMVLPVSDRLKSYDQFGPIAGADFLQRMKVAY